MQIREKGRKVICLKTRYSKEHKRTFGRVVASQPKEESTVSEEVRRQLQEDLSTVNEESVDKLTEEQIRQQVEKDVDELQEWLSNRSKKEDVDINLSRLSLLSSVMGGASEALDMGKELSEKETNEILVNLGRLKKSLRKRGIKLNRQTKKQSVKKDDKTEEFDW